MVDKCAFPSSYVLQGVYYFELGPTVKCYFVVDRRPVLKGDNLWRGHAAAFIRHARLAPEDVLCEGRVLQVNFMNASSISVIPKLLHFLQHVCLVPLELEEPFGYAGTVRD